MEELITVMKNGGVVLIPTDTIYGISGDATNIKAIEKVYEIKKRDERKPLIVLVNSKEMLLKYVDGITELEEKLIDEYWPGPLTIIFKKNDLLPYEVSGGLETIAIRYPDNKILNEIMSQIEKPIYSTSANLAGAKVINKVEEFDNRTLEQFDYILDNGYCDGEPSTLIKVNNEKITILRDGVLSESIKNKFKDYIN